MKKQTFILTSNTRIITDLYDAVILRSIKRMYRDIKFVLQRTNGESSTIRLIRDFTIEDEGDLIDFSSQTHMQIKAKDGLGFTYGLLFISEYFMKILPFWFWNVQKIQQTDQIQIPMQPYQSENYPVRFRGWFINDEVLIDHWKVNGDSDYPWEIDGEQHKWNLNPLAQELFEDTIQLHGHIYAKCF